MNMAFSSVFPIFIVAAALWILVYCILLAQKFFVDRHYLEINPGSNDDNREGHEKDRNVQHHLHYEPALSQTIIESASKTVNISEHAGYYSAFFIYLVFTFGHFVATPIVEIITPKWSIVSGLIGYGLYESSFIFMNEFFMYFAAACAGFSGSLLWTGQFDYLAQNSRPETLDRNSSNLWALSQSSLIIGGIFLLVIYRFQEGDGFDEPLIRTIIASFLVCTSISTIIALFLPTPAFKAETYKIPYLKHLGEIVQISFTPNLVLLFFTFCYTGIELSFFSVVYPTMVSFTKKLGNNRDLNAVSSICVGIGNIIACVTLSSLGHRVRVIGRKIMVLIGSVTHLLCFILIFLTFPNESPLNPTNDVAFFPPSVLIIIICGILLGFGDTILNQQCYTALSDIYEHDQRIEAFAVYRFYQSAASCAMLFYSASVALHTHLVILGVFCILGMCTFFAVKTPEKSNAGMNIELKEPFNGIVSINQI